VITKLFEERAASTLRKNVRQWVPLKCSQPATRLHGHTTQTISLTMYFTT